MSSLANRSIREPRSRLAVGASSSKKPSGSSSFMSSSPLRARGSHGTETLCLPDRPAEEQQRIHKASIMREENELLIWTSLDRNESIPQTKLHYERDMLFIDSDPEESQDMCPDDDESGGSGSVEWEESLDWDEEDHQRMRPGVVFGPDGWWDPKVHKSAHDRLEQEKEMKARERLWSERIKEDDGSPALSPRNRRKSSGFSGSSSPGGMPVHRRASGGKRAFGMLGSS
ncbi:uncharacterized protein PV09_07249 [Verruconis gallopava]|uniref:Uncharacterized protein n=1 Tax=Verruconis gallopava TaxID=253628 RepID=A0A0D1XG80_9PEZI|nr:uncharacterized protein PV09_07249 [Verruconis gallopava]KIW01201.1 hypothetical protein PV09_07249 [Verruconis gallopava]